jgi:hypothetical protein
VFGNVLQDLQVLVLVAGYRVEQLACQVVAGFIDDFLKDFGLEVVVEMLFYFGIKVSLLAFERVENWKEVKRISQGCESILDAFYREES